MDIFTKKKRSEVMARIRGKDTSPEIAVRRILHAMGFRYRLHARNLPGKPDLVFPGRRKVIFIHGCWWHRHDCRLGRRTPKSRQDYWIPKLEGNKMRDKEVRKKLKALGWKILVIWECQTRDPDLIRRMAGRFLTT